MGRLLGKNNISLAQKKLDSTWISNDLSFSSNLDHVWHNQNVVLKKLGTRGDNNDFFVRVFGWQQLAGEERRDYVDHISDHCLALL